MRIIDKLHERSALTPTEREIAGYLEDKGKDCLSLSLDELADAIPVSKSTLIRFCKKLGYKGHKEFILAFSRELNTFLVDDRQLNASFPYLAEDDVQKIIDKTYALNYGALVQTYQDIDQEALVRTARLIYEKKRIALFVDAETLPQALNFENSLETIGIHAKIIGEPVERASLLESDSVALFVSYKGRNESLVQAARLLEWKKVPAVLITGPLPSPLKSVIPDVLSAIVYESSPKAVSISSRNGIQLVLDMIFGLLYHKDCEKNQRKIEERDSLYKSI